jgi:hypothetical protein
MMRGCNLRFTVAPQQCIEASLQIRCIQTSLVMEMYSRETGVIHNGHYHLFHQEKFEF